MSTQRTEEERDQELRLECLKIAAYPPSRTAQPSGTDAIVKDAEKMYNFITNKIKD